MLKVYEKICKRILSIPICKTSVCIVIIVFLWPAIYLCRDIIPIGGTYTAIGNDFVWLYYPYKAYLLSSLAHGHLPLWSPSEAAGYPFFSNPFAQVFYPLNLLLVPYCYFMGGYTLLDHQVFTILGLCIFSLGLYLWLRLIVPNSRAVFFSVLIMSVSFKMTEIVRFPNAVHSAAWYPWVLYAMTQLFVSKTNKYSLYYIVLLIFSVVCLCTAGYSYYFYYSVFLFPVYFCIFLYSPLRQQLFSHLEFQIKRGVLSNLIAGGIASCVCMPYLIAIAGQMLQTVDRGGGNYVYSTAHVFNIQDTLGSLIYPPFAQTEGWYFFSITALLVILIYVLTLLWSAGTCKILTGVYSQEPRVSGVLFLLGWIIFVSCISYGKDSILFKLLWNLMPGFSCLRVWGRINIILVPLFAWLLSMSYSFFEKILHGTDDISKRNKFIALMMMTISYGVIVSIQYYLYINKMVDGYWKFFPYLAGYEVYFLIFGLMGYWTLLLLILLHRGLYHPVLRYTLPLLSLLMIASVEMWPVGANTWTKKNAKVPQRRLLDIALNNKQSFATPRLPRYGNISLTSAFHTGISPNWDFKRYVKFLKDARNQASQKAVILAVTNPKRVFLSRTLQHGSIQSFLNESQCFQDTGKMISYTGDELIWELTMPVDGYFSFIDNWDPYWTAHVDGQETRIELLFDTFKSVRLSKGQHRIEFRYQPTLCSIFLVTISLSKE